MLAGLIGLIVTLWYWNSRRRTVVQEQRPVTRTEGQVVDEYRTVRREEPPPPAPPTTQEALLGEIRDLLRKRSVV
jgi:large-conductance mechanosensitive channel